MVMMVVMVAEIVSRRFMYQFEEGDEMGRYCCVALQYEPFRAGWQGICELSRTI